MDTPHHDTRTELHQELLSGPVANFLNRAGDDPLDVIERLERLEAASEHWFRTASEYARIIDEDRATIQRLSRAVERQAETIAQQHELIAKTAADLHECHVWGFAEVDRLDGRIDDMVRPRSIGGEVASVLLESRRLRQLAS